MWARVPPHVFAIFSWVCARMDLKQLGTGWQPLDEVVIPGVTVSVEPWGKAHTSE